jgi:hypothetical protein
MKKMTRDEWLKLGKKYYGDDVEKWKVRCPMCGKVTELSEYKAAGAESPDCAFVECIGRYTGQGSPDKANGNGCNWAAYGFFGIPRNDKYIITFPDGTEKACFPFADEPVCKED